MGGGPLIRSRAALGTIGGEDRLSNGRQLSLQAKQDSAYCGLANQSEVRMPLKARKLVLTKSQAACLVALQHRKSSKAEIAILAKLDLLKTAAAVLAQNSIWRE